MNWIVQNLYALVEAYWVLDWPPISWIVALLLTSIPITVIGFLIGSRRSSAASPGGFLDRTKSMDPDEPD